MSNPSCTIIGASHAAASLALSLRQGGWAGRIRVLGEESDMPYQRPPLSKDVLAGAKTAEMIQIRPAALYEKSNIEFLLGVRVEQIDRENKLLRLSDGKQAHYDKLALTLGSRARTIPLEGSDLEGVFYLRTVADVLQIQPYVAKGKRAVIIGGGYIGLEAAAVLRKLDMEITIIEALPRVLQRVTAPEVSLFFQRIHAEEGVKILTKTGVSSIEQSGPAKQVVCDDGTVHEADLVIIAVGIVPNVELAADAGLAVDNGILVDEFTRTSDPDIVAAGDCTCHFNPIYQRNIRLESVQNANDQAKTAAATLCGKPEPYRALPWFWSEQYDVKLQIAGLSQGYDGLTLRGNPDEGRSFAVFYFSGDRLLAVDAINRPAEFMLGKRLLTQGIDVDREKLADDSLSAKDLLPA